MPPFPTVKMHTHSSAVRIFLFPLWYYLFLLKSFCHGYIVGVKDQFLICWISAVLLRGLW